MQKKLRVYFVLYLSKRSGTRKASYRSSPILFYKESTYFASLRTPKLQNWILKNIHVNLTQ